MAKTTKKKTLTKKTAKAAAKTESKTAQEQLKLTAEPEAKKITAEKEPEKLTTKKIEKITTAKEAEKLTTAPAPEKIETKETVKLETSAAKTTEKAEEKKPTEAKAETKKKPAAKKTAAKKTTKKEESKEEAVKAEDKPVKKVAKKTAAAKKAEPTAKKAVKKTEEKKAAAKKAAPKKVDKEKLEAYAALSLDEAIQRHGQWVVQHVCRDIRFLLDGADSKQIAKNIIDGNALSEKGFAFDKDGFDTDLISVVLEKVADTMDVKAMDYKELKKDISACLKAEMTADAEANAAEYLKEFKVCEKLLMIGQRKNITDAAIVSDLIGADVDAFAFTSLLHMQFYQAGGMMM